MQQQTEQPVITVTDLMRRWRVDRKTILGMISRGDLPAIRAGLRVYRIPLRAIEDLETTGNAPTQH